MALPLACPGIYSSSGRPLSMMVSLYLLYCLGRLFLIFLYALLTVFSLITCCARVPSAMTVKVRLVLSTVNSLPSVWAYITIADIPSSSNNIQRNSDAGNNVEMSDEPV